MSCAQTKDDYCVNLQIGEINPSTGNFVAWNKWTNDARVVPRSTFSLKIQINDLMQSLFYPLTWPTADVPDTTSSIADQIDAFRTRVLNSRSRFQLEARDGRMAYSSVDKLTKEVEWISVCNFELVELSALNMFVEDDAGEPYARIVCRSVIDEAGEGAVILTAEDAYRTPYLSGKHHLDVDVLIQVGTLRSNADVKKLFQQAHIRLHCTVLTPDMLSCWIAEQWHPEVTRCIVRFGRQPDGEFVTGNLWFKGATLLSHDVANVGIVPAYFKKQLLPMTRDDYPRNIVIPQCHVRYEIVVNFYQQLMPQMFANNLVAARAVFAHGVMGLYASKIWNGEAGFGNGVPFAYAYSPEYGTGKTTAMMSVLAMYGMRQQGPLAGDTSKPAEHERLNLLSDMNMCVDDIVHHGDQSKPFAILARTIHDRTTRAVLEKVRRPYSTATFSVTCLLHCSSNHFL